jgi:hypothetical protein
MLGRHDVIAILYLVTVQIDAPTTVALLASARLACPDVLVGVTELRNGCGAAVKLLEPSSASVQAALRTAWNAVRLALLE